MLRHYVIIAMLYVHQERTDRLKGEEIVRSFVTGVSAEATSGLIIRPNVASAEALI